MGKMRANKGVENLLEKVGKQAAAGGRSGKKRLEVVQNVY
jgi:hypothetical protein